MKKDYFEKFILQNINKNIIPKNKKILITGSNGFIGRYLVYVLANIFKNRKNLIYGIDINKNLNFSKNYIYLKKDLTLLKKKICQRLNSIMLYIWLGYHHLYTIKNFL